MRLSAAELRTIVAAGEGRTSEFKRGVQRDATLARTLAAFANTRGGLLLVGVGDKGAILGAPHPRETMRRLEEIARKQVDPPVAVVILLVSLEEGSVVCCSVPLSPDRPHAAIDDEGRRTVLVRKGSSNRVAGAADVAAMTPSSPRELHELEARVLQWIDTRSSPTADNTTRAFAKASGVGIQRSRSAFLALERAGLLVGHGKGDRRVFERPR
jgi:hypothetical protein